MTDDATDYDPGWADNGPSPWVPCPECGGIHFTAQVTFQWGEPDGLGGWRETHATFTPSGAVLSAVTCRDCGTTTDLVEHYLQPDAPEGV